MKNTERRFSELRIDNGGLDEGAIIGRAVSYTHATDLGGMLERIAPGACARAIREKQNTYMLVNHEESRCLGSVEAGNLRLIERSDGLYFNCSPLPDTSDARDARELCRKGILKRCSFGFRARKDSYGYEMNAAGVKMPCRTVEDLDLVDCSLVTFPAYGDDDTGKMSGPATQATARSFVDLPDTMPVEMRSAVVNMRKSIALRGNDGDDARIKRAQEVLDSLKADPTLVRHTRFVVDDIIADAVKHNYPIPRKLFGR